MEDWLTLEAQGLIDTRLDLDMESAKTYLLAKRRVASQPVNAESNAALDRIEKAFDARFPVRLALCL